MTLYMTWGSDWIGQASATLPDIDAACAALHSSIRRSLRWLTPAWRGCLMKTAGHELSRRMDTEARDCLAIGHRWEGVSGPLWVRLAPALHNGPQHKAAGPCVPPAHRSGRSMSRTTRQG